MLLDRLGRAGPVELAVTERIMEWSSAQGLKTAYTAPKGKPPETFIPLVTDRGININPFAVKVGDRRVFLGGSSLRKVRPFSNRAAYDDLLRKVLAVPGMVPTEKDLYPNIRLVDLAEPDTWAAFVEVMEWAVAELHRASAG